jgi:hypothetical protein
MEIIYDEDIGKEFADEEAEKDMDEDTKRIRRGMVALNEALKREFEEGKTNTD